MKGRKTNPMAKKDRQKCDFFKKGNPQKKIKGAVKATKKSDVFFFFKAFKKRSKQKKMRIKKIKPPFF